MMRLNNADYKKVIKAICDIQSAWQADVVMNLNKDTIINYSDQFDETQMSLRSLYLNYRQNASHQTLTNDSAEDIMYNLWDMMTELNGADNHDHFLKQHLQLCRVWLLMAQHANAHIERRFNRDLEDDESGLSFDHFVNVYSRDAKQMKLELKYYWSAVRDYGWGSVKFNHGPLGKSVNINKPES